MSAFASSSEQTTPILVSLVMAQLVPYCGIFAVVNRAAVEQLSWLVPALWGYAAAAATVDLRVLAPQPGPDPLWLHTPSTWAWTMTVSAGQTVLLMVRARLALRRHEPGRR